jgi:hypothetical protein
LSPGKRFAAQAVRTAKKSLGEAEATGHPITQCYVLALAACPIAFWVGDHVAAARYAAMLVDLSPFHRENPEISRLRSWPSSPPVIPQTPQGAEAEDTFPKHLQCSEACLRDVVISGT